VLWLLGAGSIPAGLEALLEQPGALNQRQGAPQLAVTSRSVRPSRSGRGLVSAGVDAPPQQWAWAQPEQLPPLHARPTTAPAGSPAQEARGAAGHPPARRGVSPDVGRRTPSGGTAAAAARGDEDRLRRLSTPSVWQHGAVLPPRMAASLRVRAPEGGEPAGGAGAAAAEPGGWPGSRGGGRASMATALVIRTVEPPGAAGPPPASPAVSAWQLSSPGGPELSTVSTPMSRRSMLPGTPRSAGAGSPAVAPWQARAEAAGVPRFTVRSAAASPGLVLDKRRPRRRRCRRWPAAALLPQQRAQRQSWRPRRGVLAAAAGHRSTVGWLAPRCQSVAGSEARVMQGLLAGKPRLMWRGGRIPAGPPGRRRG
jgi:hypothetical protein